MAKAVDPNTVQKTAELILAHMREHSPECSFEKYAEMTGITIRTVSGWAAKEQIPTIKRGKRRMVNLAAVTIQNIQSAIQAGHIAA